MGHVSMEDFERVEVRAGTVVRAEAFPEARKPSLKLWVDFGEAGVLQSSAQITAHYDPALLVGRQVVGLLNVPARRIGPFESQFLTTGFEDEDGRVVLCVPDRPVPNGSRLF